MVKVAVGMPTTGTVKTATVFSLLQLVGLHGKELVFLTQESSAVHYNRERIAMSALERGCSHLLFVDSDIVFPIDGLKRLLAHRKPIVGTNYHKRSLPLEDTALRPEQDYGLTTCQHIGMGFTLIETTVFKNLRQPYFFWESNQRGELTAGEDKWFCDRARDMGYTIWVDLDIPIKHIGDYAY